MGMPGPEFPVKVTGQSVQVIKLGGSLSGSPDLLAWLETLTSYGATAGDDDRLVIVPGGGPFADTVRESQKATGFSDACAHNMAVLAMEQYGHMLISLAASLARPLVPAASLEDICEMAGQEKIPVWMPSVMVGAAGDIPKNWDVTSDSLAAWLAGQLGADGLLLVKSADPEDHPNGPGKEVPLSTLQAAGLIDPAFGGFVAGAQMEIRCVGPKGYQHMVRAGGHGDWPGVRVGA